MIALQTAPRVDPSFHAGLLRPVRFPSWVATCGHLVATIASGPGLVVLVGAEGSGKTYTLLAVATGGGRRTTAIRSPDEATQPGVLVDMVDDVDVDGLEALVSPPPGMVRVLAVHPDHLPAIDALRPDRRVVGVQPMTRRDVRAFLEVRRSQIPPPVDAYVLRALAKLASFQIHTPAVLDRLIERIFDESAGERARRVAATRERVARVVAPQRPLAGSMDGSAGFDFARLQPAPDGRPNAAAPFALPGAARREHPIDTRYGRPRAGVESYAADISATFQPVPFGAEHALDNPRNRTAFEPREPIFAATSWDMLQATPAEIEQAGPVAKARQRRQFLGASAMIAAVVVAALLVGKPHFGPPAAGPRGDSVAALATRPDLTPAPSTSPPMQALASIAPVNIEIPARPEPSVLAPPAPPTPFIKQAPRSAPVAAPAELSVADLPLPPSPPPAIPAPPAAAIEPSTSAIAAALAARPETRLTVADAAATIVPPRPPTASESADDAEAGRLLQLGRIMLAIGQTADGRKMLEASAERGNAEASSLIVAQGWGKPVRNAAHRATRGSSTPRVSR